MKAVKVFKLRTLLGEHIIVADGPSQINFNKIVMLNETAAFIWQKLVDFGECSLKDLTDAILEEYEVDEPTASQSVASTIDQWKQIGLVED